jgi:hypothetical protein
MKYRGAEKIRQELVTTLGIDTYGRSQIKTWLKKCRNGDLSCRILHAPGGRP